MVVILCSVLCASGALKCRDTYIHKCINCVRACVRVCVLRCDLHICVVVSAAMCVCVVWCICIPFTIAYLCRNRLSCTPIGVSIQGTKTVFCKNKQNVRMVQCVSINACSCMKNQLVLESVYISSALEREEGLLLRILSDAICGNCHMSLIM